MTRKRRLRNREVFGRYLDLGIYIGRLHAKYGENTNFDWKSVSKP